MRKHQRGLGAFGSLVVVVLFVAGGYYAYKYAMEPDSASAPSCKGQLNSCTVNCRKTTTEAQQYQACQLDCNAKAETCEANRR